MQDNIFTRVEVEIKKTYYIYNRYNAKATFALLSHDKPLSFEELGDLVRISDKFIELDEHTYFIIFAFTVEENASKAAQNLLLKLDKFFNNRTSYIAINSLVVTDSTKMVMNRLTQTLTQTKKHQYSRTADENILNTMY